MRTSKGSGLKFCVESGSKHLEMDLLVGPGFCGVADRVGEARGPAAIDMRVCIWGSQHAAASKRFPGTIARNA